MLWRLLLWEWKDNCGILSQHASRNNLVTGTSTFFRYLVATSEEFDVIAEYITVSTCQMDATIRVIALFSRFSLHVKANAGSRLDVLCVLCELRY